MPGRFDAAEMPRLDAFDEEFGQDSVAIQRGQRRKTREWFWTFFSVALGVGVISVLALGWSAADRRLRLELQSAVVAPISPPAGEGLEEEIDGLRRQVEALKHEITKLKDAREQTAQIIAALRAAEQESRDRVPSTYWYSDPVALSVGESQPEREGIVPLPQPPPTARPALRRAEQSENRGTFRRKLRSDYP
jgi:cell division protein FtsB